MRTDLFRIAAVAMVAALIGGGTVAWADHQFGDVAGGSFFHESVTAIVDAGCAIGYPDNTFRPNTNATRGQFAYWLNNCGGRAEFDRGNDAFDLELDGDEVTDLATASMTSGAKGTGQSITIAIATIYVNTSGDQQSTWTLDASSGGGPDFTQDDAILSVVTPDIIEGATNPSDSITLMAQVVQAAGSTIDFSVSGALNGGAPLANVEAELSVVSFPFQGDGQAADVPL